MRSLVAYSSVTGNTQMVAEAIAAALPGTVTLAPVREAPDPEAFDFIALGFWTSKAAPDPLMARYMRTVHGKRVAFFGTMAAYPDSPHARNVKEAATELLAGNTILGHFFCQGKLPQERLNRRLDGTEGGTRHPMTEERRIRLLEAAKHPDHNDLATARELFHRLHGQCMENHA